MFELNDFYNFGFGWICRHCERDLARENVSLDTRSRITREGEAESNQPDMSTIALAKWADPAHRTLVCPRCGITESVDIL
ncbi:MAG: hypothetical protein ABIU09_02140 [Pyrinomonadaceae bacterium]